MAEQIEQQGSVVSRSFVGIFPHPSDSLFLLGRTELGGQVTVGLEHLIGVRSEFLRRHELGFAERETKTVYFRRQFWVAGVLQDFWKKNIRVARHPHYSRRDQAR